MSFSTKKHDVVTIADVSVTSTDIVDGIAGCRIANLCMVKVAFARALLDRYGVLPHESKVKVDGGDGITFNLRGYRWRCSPVPKAARFALIKFDDVLSRARKAKKTRIEQERLILAAIKPFKFTVVAVKMRK